jgi:hypothetical protein
MASLPPVIAASSLYDSFLRSALRRFFDRATLETEPIPSVSSDGRLAIEPTEDPAVLTVRWFGVRYLLRVHTRRPFTAHEIRLARAIGRVLAARFRATLNPQFIAERGELFRGSIEDRYLGAFLDDQPYGFGPSENRGDRIASTIEVLRVAALSSYENRPISTGVLMLTTEADPVRGPGRRPTQSPLYSPALTMVKSFYRLVDGLNTVFLLNRDARLLDVIDVERWGSELAHEADPVVPCAEPYRPHARATLATGNVCVVLSPSHEIKVFAEGAQVFTFRAANWQLLDLQAKYDLWVHSVGDQRLAQRLFQCALDLADARKGALFVVVRHPSESVPHLVVAADRLDLDPLTRAMPGGGVSRRELLSLVSGKTVDELDPSVLRALATLDGAVVTDGHGTLIACGAILRHPPSLDVDEWVAEGARTTAAMAASRFGPVLKVSEDGMITFFDRERIWDI